MCGTKRQISISSHHRAGERWRVPENPIYGSCCYWTWERWDRSLLLCLHTSKNYLSQNRNVLCKKDMLNSFSPPPTSPRFCQHGSAHTQALLFSFLHPSRKTCCNPLPPSHSNSTPSQQQAPDRHPLSRKRPQLLPGI